MLQFHNDYMYTMIQKRLLEFIHDLVREGSNTESSESDSTTTIIIVKEELSLQPCFHEWREDVNLIKNVLRF